ncbi:hypothetical protein ACRTDU_14535 [Sunxiuqinia elliptica]|uniref:Uncharacterized protein n=1 Tax=Sunxiuqinia elliptica TaxID=655355 RepID=A0A1I2BCL2_9BACT|nr:hypothetical protein [Sunxiuqinia elliptica]SFE53942.1 hypothetical protein SAMN05216283_101380 [Sunxiuqinia elliptica]
MKKRCIIALLTILTMATNYACQEDDLEGIITTDPALIEKLYEHSADTLKIASQQLTLETELYRNFTPGIGPIKEKNRRLIAPIWIVNTDSTVITQELTVSNLYVINQHQIWTSEPGTNPENSTPEYKSFFISKDGPEWETGISVDVVIKITDLTDNNEKYLIARNQMITKVQ